MLGLDWWDALYLLLLVLMLPLVFLLLDQYGIGRAKDAPPLVSGRLPFVGCFYDFWRDPLEFLAAQRKIHGDVFSLKMGGLEYTMVLEPSFVRQFFRAPESQAGCAESVFLRGIFVPLIGDKVLTGKEVKGFWDTHDVFKGKFAPKMTDMATGFEQVLEKALQEGSPDAGVWNSGEFFSTVVIKMTVQAILGPDLVDDEAFLAHVKKHPPLVAEAEQSLIPAWPLVFHKSKAYHRKFHEFLKPVVEKRRALQRQCPTGWREEYGYTDFLSCMLDQYAPGKGAFGLSDDAMMRVMLAVSSAIVYAALANTPAAVEGSIVSILSKKDVQAKVCGEIEAACRKNGSIAGAPMSDLRYLDACFKEYTRLQPGLMLTRLCKKPLKLPNGYVAGSNTLVGVIPQFIMRDKRFFSEPDEFQPDRVFGDEFKRAERELLFLPFGHGRHKCQGVSMAATEIKIGVGALMRNYELELLDPFPGIVAKSSNMACLDKSVRIGYKRRQQPLGA